MPKVYFVPKKVAQQIKSPTNVISINDPYGSWAEFGVKHNLLKLGFINYFDSMSDTSKAHLIKDEQIQEIMDFVKPIIEKGEDIVIHCGEGSVRSPAIATFISNLSDYAEGSKAYIPSGTFANHRGSDAHACRFTIRRCNEYHAIKATEGKELLEQSEVAALVEEAGLEWRQVWYSLVHYRVLALGRRFIKEDVIATIEKLKSDLATNNSSGVKDASVQ